MIFGSDMISVVGVAEAIFGCRTLAVFLEHKQADGTRETERTVELLLFRRSQRTGRKDLHVQRFWCRRSNYVVVLLWRSVRFLSLGRHYSSLRPSAFLPVTAIPQGIVSLLSVGEGR
jgi:hypothetical protein